MDSQPNIYQTFKEKLTPTLSNFSRNEKGTLTNSFYEASIILILKPNEDVTSKEN
jgi:hypothetical protein